MRKVLAVHRVAGEGSGARGIDLLKTGRTRNIAALSIREPASECTVAPIVSRVEGERHAALLHSFHIGDIREVPSLCVACEGEGVVVGESVGSGVKVRGGFDRAGLTRGERVGADNARVHDDVGAQSAQGRDRAACVQCVCVCARVRLVSICVRVCMLRDPTRSIANMESERGDEEMEKEGGRIEIEKAGRVAPSVQLRYGRLSGILPYSYSHSHALISTLIYFGKRRGEGAGDGGRDGYKETYAGSTAGSGWHSRSCWYRT